jgi:predicted TIM-barrel fold metal-dependent hydrolase
MKYLPLLLLIVSCSSPLKTNPRYSTDFHMHVHENIPNEDMKFDAERALFAADSIGVKRALILSRAYHANIDAKEARKINEFVISEARRNPSKLVAACGINPKVDYVIDELRFCRYQKIRVIKLHTMASGMDLKKEDDRKKLETVLAEADQHDQTVLIHGNFPQKQRGNEAQELLKVIAKFPELRIIIGHLLGREFEQLKLLKHSNVFIEISIVPIFMKSAADKERLLTTMRFVGMRKFLFGSDWPVIHPAETMKALRDLGLTESEINLIINDNPKRLNDLFEG